MRKHKYNAKPTYLDGYHFDSKAEADRYKELLLAQNAGVISDLKVHQNFVLQPAFRDNTGKSQRQIIYEADFVYREAGKEKVTVEDLKGYETPVFKLKRKMFLFHYPEYELRITR